MKCKVCGYIWKSRIKMPKSCPRCKCRFDYPYKEILKDIEKEKVMEGLE